MKIQKKNFGWGEGRGGEGRGGCERRIEVFVKIQKKNCQGGCRQRIEVFLKIKKKWGGWGVGWVRGGGGRVGGSGWMGTKN